MEKQLIKEIFDWDIVNWSKTLPFWENYISVSNKELECLELGASKGGLSLWLALNNNNVLCTDLNGPDEGAREIHRKYDCTTRIKYDAIDATNIPYHNHFDIVIFKSILGGISSHNNANKARTVYEIHKALKPGGLLLFAENLKSTRLHQILRKKFGTPGWNYLQLDEIPDIFSQYRAFYYTTAGFLGCMGRNEQQRNFLGQMDSLFEKLIPERNRYIVIGVAVK